MARALIVLGIGFCIFKIGSADVQAAAPSCAANASVQNGIAVAPSHGQAFYIDTGASPKIDAGYIGYRVTNTTGSAQQNLWTETSDFTGGILGLANSLDRYQQVTSLANNATAASYFLLKASSATAISQTHRVKVWNGRPDLPSSQMLYDCVYTFSAVKETIKAAANKVSDTGYGAAAAIEVSNTSPEVGQTIVVSVEGVTGTMGAGSAPDGSIVWLTPAAISSWPTRALRLENVSATFERNSSNGQKWTGSGDQVTYTNQLLIANAQNCLKKGANVNTCTGGTGSASAEYRAFYTFRVVGIPSSTVKAVPVAQIASGTQIKHADITATGATLDISFPAVTINASLTKSITATTGLQTVTCSIACSVPGGVNGETYALVPYRLTGTSSTATTVSIDEIVDQPQDGVIYNPGSAKITDIGRAAVSIGDPSYVSSESAMAPRPLHFVGPFNLNQTTTATLDYEMWVPVGSFTNTAYAKIGDLLIGASASSMSKIVVTSDGSGTVDVVTATEELGVVASTEPATNIQTSSATINGTVDPNGANPLVAQFAYSTNANLGSPTTVTATTPANGTVGGLTTPTNVSYTLTGLSANTTYYYRVAAGAAQGTVLSFTTDAILAPPTATTSPATSITSSGATLNGVINPNLTSVLVIQFIYSTSPIFAVGNTTVTLDDGTGANLTASGASAQPFSASAAGLASGTTYYYKIRACTTANCSSFVDGSAVSFVAQNPPSNPVLSVTKTEDDADNSVAPGQTVTYTVTITNNGGVTGTTSFTDAIPTGMGMPSGFSYTNCGSPSSNYAPPTLTVSSITIAASTSCAVVYSVTIANPLNEGTTLTNNADVAAASEGGNNPSPVFSSILTVNATPNLSTSTKSVIDVNSGAVEPGDVLTYTVTVSNTGDGRASQVSVTDSIDSDTQNLTNVSYSNCGSPTNNSTSTQLAVTGVAVAVSTPCSITFDVSVKSPLNSNTAITNTATISMASEGGAGASPSSSTLYSSATPALGVAHAEADSDNIVSPGEVVGYSIAIQNTGNGQATSVSAASTINSNVVLNTGSFSYDNCGTPASNSTGTTIALSSVMIATGDTCTITYSVQVNALAAGGATIASSVDIGQAAEGGNNPSPVSASVLAVAAISTPGNLEYKVGATTLECGAVTKTRSVRLAWGAVNGATGYEVSLDGGAATDTDNNIYYDWTMPNVEGVHTFTVRALDATNDPGAWSAACQITLDQIAPSVDAGADKTTSAGFTQSSASASDGGSGIATYSWAKVSGPGLIAFSNSAILHPTITATSDGSYVIRLTGTDAAGNSLSDTFELTWSTAQPVIVNDDDGADVDEEQAAPNSGDANNDGMPDGEQKNVTSYANPITNTYAILENIDNCQNTNVNQKKVTDLRSTDGSYAYPAGLMNFTLVCGVPGATVRINQYFYGLNADTIIARKYNSVTSAYTTIADAEISVVTIGGQNALKISYLLTDGGEMDEDGQVNGIIVDPSGPAVLGSAIAAPNTGLAPQSLAIPALCGLLGMGLLLSLVRKLVAPAQ